MSKNRKSRNDNLVGGLALIGAGIGWLWGAFLPGLLIGLGVGLIISATRAPEKPGANLAVTDSPPQTQEETTENQTANQTAGSESKAIAPDDHADRDIEVVWARILAHQGQVFHQAKGQAFTYEVVGNALVPSTTKARIYKSQFAKALEHVPFGKVSDVPPDVFGPSYVYAILMDPRIRQNDW